MGPLFPDCNRNSLTVGGSLRTRTGEFTFFYEAMFFAQRNTSVAANNNIFTNGLYDNFAHVIGMGLRIGTKREGPD